MSWFRPDDSLPEEDVCFIPFVLRSARSLQVAKLGLEAKWPREHLLSNHCCTGPLSPFSTAVTSAITRDIIMVSFDLPGSFSSLCWAVQGKREYQNYVPKKDKCLPWCFFTGALRSQYERNAVARVMGTHEAPVVEVRPEGVWTPLQMQASRRSVELLSKRVRKPVKSRASSERTPDHFSSF